METAIRQIRTIAFNVVRQTLRNRSFLVLAGSGCMMFVFSHVLGTMSVGGTLRVVQNAGFWVLGMWGLVTAVFLGAGLVKDEVENKTAYLILSRPVSRATFLTGKFFGMLLAMGLLFVILASFMTGHLYVMAIEITGNYVVAVVFILLEWVMLAAFSMLFAAFTSPLMLGLFLSAIYFFGHGSKTIYILARNTETLWIKQVLLYLYYLFPNLEAVNFRAAALYNDPIALATMIHGAGTAVAWVVSLFAAALLVFHYRKLL